jgi:hypothetical protein
MTAISAHYRQNAGPLFEALKQVARNYLQVLTGQNLQDTEEVTRKLTDIINLMWLFWKWLCTNTECPRMTEHLTFFLRKLIEP